MGGESPRSQRFQNQKDSSAGAALSGVATSRVVASRVVVSWGTASRAVARGAARRNQHPVAGAIRDRARVGGVQIRWVAGSRGGDGDDHPLVLGADYYRVNSVPIVQATVPEQPVFAGVVEFSQYNDANGTAVAVDGQRVAMLGSHGGT